MWKATTGAPNECSSVRCEPLTQTQGAFAADRRARTGGLFASCACNDARAGAVAVAVVQCRERQEQPPHRAGPIRQREQLDAFVELEPRRSELMLVDERPGKLEIRDRDPVDIARAERYEDLDSPFGDGRAPCSAEAGAGRAADGIWRMEVAVRVIVSSACPIAEALAKRSVGALASARATSASRSDGMSRSGRHHVIGTASSPACHLYLHTAPADEGRGARDELVQDHAGPIRVGGKCGRSAANDFRRQVLRRSGHCGWAQLAHSVVQNPRNSEIDESRHELAIPRRLDEDIVGLDVGVDDALGVRVFEPRDDLRTMRTAIALGIGPCSMTSCRARDR